MLGLLFAVVGVAIVGYSAFKFSENKTQEANHTLLGIIILTASLVVQSTQNVI